MRRDFLKQLGFNTAAAMVQMKLLLILVLVFIALLLLLAYFRGWYVGYSQANDYHNKKPKWKTFEDYYNALKQKELNK